MRLSSLVKLFFNTLLLSGTTAGYSYAQDSAALSRKAQTDNLYYDAVKAQMLGDKEQSEMLFLRVIRERPDEHAAYYNLSRLAVGDNRADKATEYIKKAIALDGDNKWYREQYANILVLRNQTVEAASEFGQLAKKEKYNDDYLLKSALLYQRAGKYKEAMEALSTLEKKDPKDEDVLLKQQEIYLKMNDVPGAISVVQKLINRDPKEPRYYTMMAEIYENNKQPDKAAEVFKTMQQKFPDDPSTQLSLASQFLKKGDTAQYRAYVHRAITNKDLDAELQAGLLLKYLQDLSGDPSQKTEALLLTEKIIIQHPENPNLLSIYGDVLRLNGRDNDAAVQYKKVIEQNPASFPAWQQLLANYLDPKDADSLILYTEKAARLFPNQASVHYLNGIGHYNKKDNTSAVRSINRAIDLQSDEDPEGREELANMYSLRGDIFNVMKVYHESDSSFEHALRLNPNNATVLNNYAYYLSVRNQRLGDAERMSKKSLQIRPAEGTFLDTYGWILYQQGKYEQARNYIQQAIDAARGEADATLWEHMGAIHYKLGDPSKAVEAWKKAKQKGGDNPNLDKMIAERKLYE
jgi:predicted Zn-dependent protease